MIEVKFVAPKYVAQTWGRLEEFFMASVESEVNPDTTAEQLKGLLIAGDQSLLIALDGENIIGAMAIEFMDTPNQRIGFITAMGGRGIVNMEVFSQVEHYMRGQGATKAMAWAGRGQARLYRMRGGFTPTRQVMERML